METAQVILNLNANSVAHPVTAPYFRKESFMDHMKEQIWILLGTMVPLMALRTSVKCNRIFHWSSQRLVKGC